MLKQDLSGRCSVHGRVLLLVGSRLRRVWVLICCLWRRLGLPVVGFVSCKLVPIGAFILIHRSCSRVLQEVATELCCFEGLCCSVSRTEACEFIDWRRLSWTWLRRLPRSGSCLLNTTRRLMTRRLRTNWT